jgi:hypothetical protein
VLKNFGSYTPISPSKWDSSRQFAKALRENIPFMWLAGRQQPDFRTVNRFRSERMKEQLEKIFAGMLELLMAEGYIKLENYFVDGTKIEANANRYKKCLEYLRYKKMAREKLRSEDGRKFSVQRMVEVESVFGQMKNNRGFRRFLLRGLPKVSLEVGWLSLALFSRNTDLYRKRRSQ